MSTRQYSTLFTCLYDEPEPVGRIGRGTHYSIFRAVEWLDVERRPLPVPQIHDFAVVWDEDHDIRIVEAVERIYMAGLLSPVQFIGERKGGLTALVAAKFYFAGDRSQIGQYQRGVELITQGLDDPWPAEIGSFDRSRASPHQCLYEGLIQDEDDRVGLYLGAIDALWRLGTRPYRPTADPVRSTQPPLSPGFRSLFPTPPQPEHLPPRG